MVTCCLRNSLAGGTIDIDNIVAEVGRMLCSMCTPCHFQYRLVPVELC